MQIVALYNSLHIYTSNITSDLKQTVETSYGEPLAYKLPSYNVLDVQYNNETRTRKGKPEKVYTSQSGTSTAKRLIYNA